ncbi:hypothetical protein C5167_008798 [Papaver somniferum]|uniref:Endonuclease/exonuclease/phosphatase domain-containing protein n=1 Tax=Papaver somniferum TaxID=3469 RepID=A0A4Y7JVL3_PAPSO|nr:hypothetical protein C5167_008798 [Papaver somniferum]
MELLGSGEYLNNSHSSFIPQSFIGDFNVIVSGQEKFGGLPFLDSNISAINDLIHQNHLLDVGFSGPAYTWSNGRAFQGLFWQHLDRVMANPEWCIAFNCADILHLPRISSDHAPILLNTSIPIARAPPNYKFEAYWISHPEFLQKIGVEEELVVLNIRSLS